MIIKLLKILFSKKYKREYSEKVVRDYNEVVNRTEEIYMEALKDCNKVKNKVA